MARTNSPQKETVTAKKSKTRVSNQVRLDTINPIPFEYGGEVFAYIQGYRYIPFLLPNDDFFKTLLEAKTLSNTQTACIETKKRYCAGTGLYDVKGKDFSKEVLAWLNRINARNENAHTVNLKTFGSHFTFGNTPVEVVRFTVAGKKYLNIYPHNVLQWRLSWPDASGFVTSALQSKLFLRQGIVTAEQIKNMQPIPIYDPSKPNSKKNWYVDDKGAERTLIWLKNDMDGYEHYGMPSSIASLIYQVLEYKGARYNLDNFDNNLVLGGILALKGNLTQDEASRIGKQIINTYTGDGKRGRFVTVASEEGIEKSDFHQFKTQAEGSFLKFDESLVQKIILANEWDGILAGVTHMSSLGKGNTFLRTIYQIKKSTVIDPAQQFLINNMWMIIQQIAAAWHLPDMANYELGIQDIDPISILADVDPTPAVQINEVREALGMAADKSQDGTYMKPSGGAQQQGGGGV